MAVSIASLLALSLFTGSISPVNAQSAEEDLTDKLLNIMEEAEDRVTDAFARVRSLGGGIPAQAETKQQEGVAIAAEAIRLRAQGELSNAREKAVEALQKFKEGLSSIAPQLESAQTGTEAEVLKARDRNEAIERLDSVAARLEEVAEKAQGRGLDASQMRERISEVKTRLTEVKQMLQSGNISDVDRAISDAETKLDDSLEALGPVVAQNKGKQAKKYVQDVEGRLDRVSSVAVSVLEGLKKSLPAPAQRGIETALQAVQNAINRAEESINETKALLDNGRVDEAMPQIGQLRGEVAQVVSEVKRLRPDEGKGLEDIDNQETALDILERRQEILSERGVDVSSLRAKIDEARNLILGAVERLKEGDNGAVQEILGSIDEIVNEARRIADQLETQPQG
ncbi:MAG: hypothetical protein HY619_03370 [Thaumarchaeota archaeon]|nr:hypothetical protein [Nitrososphaerota archaeon]